MLIPMTLTFSLNAPIGPGTDIKPHFYIHFLIHIFLHTRWSQIYIFCCISVFKLFVLHHRQSTKEIVSISAILAFCLSTGNCALCTPHYPAWQSSAHSGETEKCWCVCAILIAHRETLYPAQSFETGNSLVGSSGEGEAVRWGPQQWFFTPVRPSLWEGSFTLVCDDRTS